MNTELWLRVDIRGGGRSVSSAALCAAAIEQTVWAEKNGFDAVLLPKHHGADDGYLPSPVVMGAAIAASTKRIRLQLGAIVLPFDKDYKQRAARVEEGIAALRGAFSGGPFTYQGRHGYHRRLSRQADRNCSSPARSGSPRCVPHGWAMASFRPSSHRG